MRGILGLLILHTPLVKLNMKMKVRGEKRVCVCGRVHRRLKKGQRRGAMPNPVGCEGICCMEMGCGDVFSSAWITKPS